MRSLSERVAEMSAQRSAAEAKRRPSFTPTKTFRPPATLDEALQRREAVVIKIQEIQAQLSQKNLPDPTTSVRLTDHDFHAWRGAAAGALRHALTENQRLKTSIRQFREEARAKAAGVDLSDPDVLIASAGRLLRRLASEGVDFDPPEQALMEALSDWKVR